MKTAIRRVPPVLTLLALALAALALAASAAPAAVGYVRESYSEFETQLKAGQIREATINKRLRTVRLTLTDGRHMLTQYQPHEEPHVRKELRSHHVTASVLSTTQAKKEQGKRPVHHKLRYIVGGVVVAVAVIVAGVMFYNRRRRYAEPA